MRKSAIVWYVLAIVFTGLWFTSIFLPQVGDRTTYFIYSMICSIKGDIVEVEVQH